MTTTPVKSVWVEFVSKFDTKPLKKAEQQTEKLSKSLKRAGAALAAAFSVKILANMAKDTIKAADALAKAARQAGTTAEELQKLQFVAQMMGASSESVTKGIEELTLKIGEAGDGSKNARKSLRAVGLTLKDLAGNSSFEQFKLVVEGLQKIPNAARRAQVANQLLGGEWKNLNNILVGTAEDLAEAEKAFEAAGGAAISNTDAANAEEYANAILSVENALSGLKTPLLKALFGDNPVEIEKATAKILEFISLIRANMGEIVKWGKIFVAVLAAGKIITILAGAASAVGAIITAGQFLIGVLATIKALFVGIAFVIGLGLGPIVGIIAGIALLVAGVAWLYQNWDQVVDKVKEFWGWIKRLVSGPLDQIASWFGGGRQGRSSGADISAWTHGTNAPAANALGSNHNTSNTTNDNSTVNMYINGTGRDPSQIGAAVRRELDSSNRRSRGRASSRR